MRSTTETMVSFQNLQTVTLLWILNEINDRNYGEFSNYSACPINWDFILLQLVQG